MCLPVDLMRGDRIQPHFLVWFLAQIMWECIETRLKAKGAGGCARRIDEQKIRLNSIDMVVFVKNGEELLHRQLVKR
ncbi:MAG: hypothetical protein K9N48_04030 [Verrucomicrobia bacterium]|nr:hypothetical protein [Verrucomicrobiota bacterium]